MPSFFFHIAFDLDTHGSAKSRLSTHSEPHDQNQHSKQPQASHETLDNSKSSTSPTDKSHDWRYSYISIQTVTMAQVADGAKHGGKEHTAEHLTNGMSAGRGGLATKGKYEPCDPQEENLGWGVVRLYRDAEETPGLYDEPASPSKHSKHHKATGKGSLEADSRFQDEDCTTLCILAVPSYLTPSDFLGFMGEKTRDEVSHFRMIRTERSNRYMVLMKFRNGKKARQWRKEWDGKAFDGIEPENCHVVFIRSVFFYLPPSQSGQTAASFPDMTNDPFTPAITLPSSPPPNNQHPAPGVHSSSSTAAASRAVTKPAPPPTPALIELPTCPVCLERMDETTGLLTILCQHVFHCSCLQKWKGSGCPVCRYTHSSLPLLHKRSHSHAGKENGESGLNECAVCHTDSNLWVCLICGSVGCGRYDAAHAFAHYQSSGHSFAMELDSQRVWDYASDVYVHRIIQDKTNGKFLEMTHDSHNNSNNNGRQNRTGNSNVNNDNDDDDFDDYVPREKLTNIGLEYTSLLTSQLDSQRLYFEETLERAADKASRVTLAAESASAAAQSAAAALTALQITHITLRDSTLPELERDKDRAVQKAERFERTARHLEREWRDEKAMSASLLERVKRCEEEIEALRETNAELKDQNRDLGFFISGGEKLRGLEGEVAEEVRVGGRVEVPVPKTGTAIAGGTGLGLKDGGKGKGKLEVKGKSTPVTGSVSGSGTGKVKEGKEEGDGEGDENVEKNDDSTAAAAAVGNPTNSDANTDAKKPKGKGKGKGKGKR